MRTALTPVLLALLLASASPARAAPLAHQQAADIRAFISKAMKGVEAVPGLAIAVVDGEDVVLAAGFGVADIRTGGPVDAETPFYIASATKSFTALAISATAARLGVELDAPVASWIGDSGLAPELADAVSLTDLLSHRSGVDNYPMAFRAAYSGDHTPAIMRDLVGVTAKDPDTPHGTFRYTNAGYNLATTLLQSRTGIDWRDLVRDEVLTAVGMSRTTARISEARAIGHVASGHLADLAETRVSPLQKTDETMQSAGGLMSTANDMARWLELQINDGVVDGQRIFPEGLIVSTHVPRVAQDKAFGVYQRTGYGLGWQTGRYGADTLVHHFGNFSGSRAHVSFMPERRLGVVVLVNEDVVAGELADVVANYVYDLFAKRPDLEAAYDVEIAGLVERRDRRRAGVAAARAERAARPWLLSRPIPSYVGVYSNPAMGTLRIGEEDGRLTVSIGVLSATAEAYTDPDTIRVELVPFQGEVLSFAGPDSLVFSGHTFERLNGGALASAGSSNHGSP